MSEKHTISIAVLTSEQEDVELVNSSLRDAGHAAHCLWIETPGKFADSLRKEQIELIVQFVDAYPDSIRQAVKEKDGFNP